jgi:uncharacterized protein YuzE
MRAEYDSEADALAIDLVPDFVIDHDEEVDGRCNVAVDRAGRPVSVEVLNPGLDPESSLTAAAGRFGLDAEALVGAARAALAAPDREIVLEVRARTIA